MATKYDYKIIQVPAGYTQAQIETALKNLGQTGWLLTQIQLIAGNYYAILVKTLSI